MSKLTETITFIVKAAKEANMPEENFERFIVSQSSEELQPLYWELWLNDDVL